MKCEVAAAVDAVVPRYNNKKLDKGDYPNVTRDVFEYLEARDSRWREWSEEERDHHHELFKFLYNRMYKKL